MAPLSAGLARYSLWKHLDGILWNRQQNLCMFLEKNICLTEQMLKTLMDCYERELLHLEPYGAAMTPSAKGLVSRGMLGTKSHTTESGKGIIAVYVTNKGKATLQTQFPKKIE